VERPVLTTVVVTIFLVLGISSFLRLTIDLFPEVDFPFVTVTTIYPGAGPEEVESQVTKKLEDAVSTLANVKRLDSINRESLSLLLMEFELGVDADLAAMDVKEKIEGVLAELPDAVEKPQVLKFDIQALPIMSLALTGPQSPRELYEVADKRVRDALSRAEGVASVTIVGGRKREILVALDQERLAAHGLDASTVRAVIARENVNVPSGRITKPGEELAIRVVGEFESLEELRRLPIPVGQNGETIPLEDLGAVLDTTAEARDLALLNGKNAVGLFVLKRSDANTVRTAAEIRRRVASIQEMLPPGVTLEIVRDNSRFISRTVNDVLVNILLGIGLTTLLLYLFLRSLPTTLVAAVVMPTSIVATFLLIDFGGFTINVMTLLALGISIGVLVANAIVVLENIARRIQEKGEDAKTAAYRGTEEVGVAVAAAALTNIVVFTPIAFMGGIVGRFFLQFGLTVVFATLFSLLVSFTLTPMLASRVMRRAGTGRRTSSLLRRLAAPLAWPARIWASVYGRLEEGYRRSLHWSLEHRLRTVLLVAVVFVASLMLFRYVGGEFVPQSDDGYVQIRAKLPAGTPLAKTREIMAEMEEIVRREVPETVGILTTVGGENRGVEEGEITLRLTDAWQRERSIQEIMNDLRPALAGIPAAEIGVQIGNVFGDEKAIVVEVLGPELDRILEIAHQIRSAMEEIPGLVDVDVSAKPGVPEVVFRPDRQELARRLLPVAAVGAELRNLYEGEIASRYREKGEEYDIRVRLAQAQKNRLASLQRVQVASADGLVPLSALGRFQRRQSVAEITRKNKERMVSVTANVGSGSLLEKVRAIQDAVAKMDIPSEYHVEYSGEYERLGESFTEILKALVLAVILTYLLLAALLESFIHPFTIMFSLPLALVGVALALFFTGTTINIMSLMAVVMLVGIVVNNAILILDYARQLRQRGISPREAILQAAPGRFRPIVMTTLAILAGILPQALGGAGAAYTVAMAVVTMGGVLASGILTLYVIPVIYTVAERERRAG
jgi:HAE1 family hydrophobic/amphiphilic exporter-1